MRRDDRQLWERVKRSVTPTRGSSRTPVAPPAKGPPAKGRALAAIGAATSAPRPDPRVAKRDRGAAGGPSGKPLPYPAQGADEDREALDAFEAWWRATEPRPAAAPPSAPPGVSPPPTAPRVRAAPRPGALDRPTVRRIAKRRVAIDGSIDLHGLTEAEAHGRLLGYLERAREAGLRHVIVVTGKGRGAHEEGGVERRGVLRRAVPRWFQTPPFARLVSGHHAAAPNDGGEGALYVKLRRERPLKA